MPMPDQRYSRREAIAVGVATAIAVTQAGAALAAASAGEAADSAAGKDAGSAADKAVGINPLDPNAPPPEAKPATKTEGGDYDY